MSSTTSPAIHATAASFEADVLASPIPVLVDFWAPWCAPCRVVKPAIEDLATELEGRVKVVLVDVDEQPELAQRFQVSSIPALKLYRDGAIVAETAGAQGREQLLSWLEAEGALDD